MSGRIDDKTQIKWFLRRLMNLIISINLHNIMWLLQQQCVKCFRAIFKSLLLWCSFLPTNLKLIFDALVFLPLTSLGRHHDETSWLDKMLNGVLQSLSTALGCDAINLCPNRFHYSSCLSLLFCLATSWSTRCVARAQKSFARSNFTHSATSIFFLILKNAKIKRHVKIVTWSYCNA